MFRCSARPGEGRCPVYVGTANRMTPTVGGKASESTQGRRQAYTGRRSGQVIWIGGDRCGLTLQIQPGSPT